MRETEVIDCVEGRHNPFGAGHIVASLTSGDGVVQLTALLQLCSVIRQIRVLSGCR